MKFLPAALAAVLLVCLMPAARAQDDDAKRAGAAAELLKAMHADQTVDLQKAAIKKSLEARLPKSLPPDVLKQIQEKMDAGLDTIFKQYNWDSVKGDFIQLYSHSFTESELKELAAFYNSPIGQKYTGKRGEIENGAMVIMQKQIEALSPQIAQLVKDTLQSIKDALPPSPGPAPGFRNPAPEPEK